MATTLCRQAQRCFSFTDRDGLADETADVEGAVKIRLPYVMEGRVMHWVVLCQPIVTRRTLREAESSSNGVVIVVHLFVSLLLLLCLHRFVHFLS